MCRMTMIMVMVVVVVLVFVSGDSDAETEPERFSRLSNSPLFIGTACLHQPLFLDIRMPRELFVCLLDCLFSLSCAAYIHYTDPTCF